MPSGDVDIEDTKGMQRLYQINPALFQAILLNQIVQNTKTMRRVLEREEFQGKVDYIKQSFTATPTWVDFHGRWKVLQVSNRGPDVFLFSTITEGEAKRVEVVVSEHGPATQRSEKAVFERESRIMDIDPSDSINLPFREDRLIGIVGNAQTTSTTVKIVLIR